jgi:hypothetical protein
MIDADRIEHLDERDSNLAQVNLVIADPDVMIRVAVNNQNFNVFSWRANLVKLPHSADGCP